MQRVDLVQPIEATRQGPGPVWINIVVTPVQQYMVGGAMAVGKKVERYVRLSALPEELQRRVEMAVQLIATGI